MITDGRANLLMDRKVVVAIFIGMVAVVAVVTSPQLLDVAWCSAVVVVVVAVVKRSCSCSVISLV